MLFIHYELKLISSDTAKAICPQLASIHTPIQCQNNMEVLKGSFMSAQLQKQKQKTTTKQPIIPPNSQASKNTFYLSITLLAFFRFTFSLVPVFQQNL